MSSVIVSKTVGSDGLIDWVYSMSIGTGGGNVRTFNVQAKDSTGAYSGDVQASIIVA